MSATAPAMSAGTAETAGLGAKPASAVRGAEAPARTSHPIPAGGAVEAGEAEILAARDAAYRRCVHECQRRATGEPECRDWCLNAMAAAQSAARALPLTSKEDRT